MTRRSMCQHLTCLQGMNLRRSDSSSATTFIQRLIRQLGRAGNTATYDGQTAPRFDTKRRSGSNVSMSTRRPSPRSSSISFLPRTFDIFSFLFCECLLSSFVFRAEVPKWATKSISSGSPDLSKCGYFFPDGHLDWMINLVPV